MDSTIPATLSAIAAPLLKVSLARRAVVTYFYHYALCRPKAINFTAVMDESTKQIYEDAKAWVHANSTQVQMTAADGTVLLGHYIPAPEAKRTLICFHGWKGYWDFELAPPGVQLHKKGCNLLMIEQRAQGASGGKNMTMGILEHEDCAAWANWLVKNHPDGLPVYLYGVSMGSATVTMAAGKPLPPQVVGVIADCGYTSPMDIFSHVAEHDFHLPVHPLLDELRDYALKKAGFDLESYTSLEAMKHCTLPFLFVHGTADAFVPCEMGKRVYAACPTRKRLLLVEGATHAGSYVTAPQRYLTAMEAFWASTEGAR